MSDEERLEEIRQKKLEQLKAQAAQQEIAEKQKEAFDAQKYQIMRKILSQKGRQRLENIRMVKPQFAEQIELQLIQLYRSGRFNTPMTDQQFKKILEKISKSNKKKDFKIKKF
ncbi:MAG: DNA-binding protein [Promethearchaeota archaeon]|nr:MAG: DNA-binding protein [Candidatus Lokiarchaeota archaeon]